MKATKWIVGAGAVLGVAGCFFDWLSLNLAGVAKAGASSIPTNGMDNGGVLFIVLLSLPLLGAVIGLVRRFGRGMGGLALAGGLLATFMALVKYADLTAAIVLVKENGLGVAAVAPGYWLLFVGSMLALVGGIVALIKPEPKRAVAAPMAPAPMATAWP